MDQEVPLSLHYSHPPYDMILISVHPHANPMETTQ